MTINFYKYQGTGNDFVIIDNRDAIISKNDTKLFEKLCDRRFGIGADGLMLLESPKKQSDDFVMVYFNSDGKESSMCGNGGRCLVSFAAFLGIVKNTATFTAIDGSHTASVKDDLVSLKMQDVYDVQKFEHHVFMDTGSPHHVTMVDEVSNYDVETTGREIRYGSPYFEAGTNVNFVEKENDYTFVVRTYERGVENETLSCGTGVTAVAIAMHATGKTDKEEINIRTKGGVLQVVFKKTSKGYEDVILTGPTKQVFKGEITW